MAAGRRWIAVSDDVTINKEMGISHQDFFRILPRALGSTEFERQGNTVLLKQDDQRLTIKLSIESQRRIAAMVVPVTNVTLTFSGYATEDLQMALDRFDQYFRKGGG
jgi:hypothetical protein